MRIALLGPLRVTTTGGTPVAVGGARLRTLLIRLALSPGRPVSTDALVDGLWGEQPPADAANALQSLVSRLRKALGTAAGLESESGGYVLAVAPDDVDAHRFESLAARGKRALAEGRPGEASVLLGKALAEFEGEPLADAAGAPFAQAPAARLAELRLGAVEDRFDAELRLGRHAEVLADLESASAEHPLRERLAALRLRALAAAGRQSEALAVYDRVRRSLADELGIDPSPELTEAHLAVLRGEVGPKALKGTLYEHSDAQRLRLGGGGRREGTLNATKVPLGAGPDLPTRLTSFIGRERELGALAKLLAEERLVTLTGPGGAGKTRLAIEAAARHLAHDRRRAWFVPLAGVRDGADVPGAIVGSLDLRMHATQAAESTADALDRIAESLRGDESLLILDNCEHVVEAAARLVHELLGRVPSLRILATSREALAIGGERLYPVGPLEVPAAGADAGQAAEAAAVRLFVDRAVAVRPGFTLDESSVGAVTEICTRLDGVPLALELAAAKLRSMTAAHVAKRLDDRFRLLTSGSRVALPRQRTLRAVVEWSWDLLDEPERVLARRLSVFPGGFTVAAAEAVCADESLPGEDVLYLIGSLTEKSIVDEAGEQAGEPRYRMLETIRAYAAERLTEAAEPDATIQRFIAHFLAVAEEHEPLFRAAGQLSAIRTYDIEYGNLFMALRKAIDRPDPGTAHRLAAALVWYWVIRGIIGQPARTLKDVLAIDDIPERARAALGAIHALLTLIPRGRVPEDIRALIDDCARTNAPAGYPMLALVLPMLAFFTRDQDLTMREVERARNSPDPWVRASAHWAESFVFDDRGDLEGAEMARDAALRGFEALGDRWGTSMTLVMKAHGYSCLGRHDAAVAAIEQGLALAAELETSDDMVRLSLRLAEEHVRAGDLDAARRRLDDARRIAAESSQPQLTAYTKLTGLELARCTGDLETAERLLGELKHAMETLDFGSEIGSEWVSVAETSLLISQGDAAGAWAVLPKAVASTSGRLDMPDTAKTAELLARLYHLEGKPERAAAALGLSHRIRGVFDRGNPELRELAGLLTAELGEQTYQDSYARGASLSKDDAVRSLREQAGLDGDAQDKRLR